jgi:hypothetical protein
MECLPEERIHDYLEGALNAMEANLIRDHLLACPGCNARHKIYQKINKFLQHPPLTNPPDSIIANVLKTLYPGTSFYFSIIALIAASFAFLVTWIYVYFDFSNSSLIQALTLTSKSTSGWIADLIQVISSVFSMVYASFKAIHSFVNYLLRIDFGPEIFKGVVLTFSMIFLYSLIHLFSRKFKEKRK